MTPKIPTPPAHPEAFTEPPVSQLDGGKPGQLTPVQVKQFFEQGYVVVENVIDTNLLDRLKQEWETAVDDLVERLSKAGKITNKHKEKDFFHRLTYVNQEYPGASVVMHRADELGPVARELWSYRKLLDILEQLLGPEIVGHPVWNVRIKLPDHESEVVPWHQDNGYFSDDACGTMIATAWIPMLDTNLLNGGMQVVRNSHRRGLLGGTWYIEMDKDVIEKSLGCDLKKDLIDCPVPYGGVLLFTNLTVHRSVTNKSDGIRWSMDLRWQDPRKPNGRAGLETVDQMPVMRTLSKTIDRVDWSVLSSRHANDIAIANGREAAEKEEEDEFDTRISGPWMRRWPIVHHNKHTQMAGIAPEQ